MPDHVIRGTPDDELIEVLSAISIVTLRLAKKLKRTTRSHPYPHDACCNSHCATCPFYQERRVTHEAVRSER